MSTCFDIYTLAGDGCHVIQTYPSAVHPHGGGVRPSGPLVSRTKGRPIPRHPRQNVLPDDDEIAIALALLNLTNR